MRRFIALARTAALESLAEPLSAVVFLAALLVVHLAPVFHYHRFGDAARLPRECGLSALLVFGLVFATSAAVRTIGRELSSGTASAALALAVPRWLFHCAKTAGVFAAFALFAAAATSATLLAARTSALGAEIAATGADVRIWGPGLAFGAGGTLLAFAAAAAANRFLRWRFCASACLLTAAAQPFALVMSVPAGGFAEKGAFISEAVLLLPSFAVLAAACLVFIALAAALATRLDSARVTAALVSAVLLSFFAGQVDRACPAAGWAVRSVLPVLSDFWTADRLVGGGALSAAETCRLVASAVLLVAFWLGAGSALLSRRELP
jgi:hypothetical protein